MANVEPIPAQPTDQSRAAVLAALSDVVTVTDPDNTEAAPKPLAPGPPATGSGAGAGIAGFGSRMAGALGRMRGNKKGAGKDDKNGKNGGKNAEAKGPSRIDVIDRLDASGLHGMSLFHHDSPYDACSPHANRHGHRAPVNAFAFEEGAPGGAPAQSRSRGQNGAGGSRQNLSPLAQATLQRMNAADADINNAPRKPPYHRSQTMDSYNSATTPFADGPSEKPPMGRAQSSDSEFSTTAPQLPYKDGYNGRSAKHDRSQSTTSAISAAGQRNNNYITAASAYPTEERSDQSNPLAEVWGIVPEPWQDFATPASANRSSNDKHSRFGGGSRSGNGGLSPYGEGNESGTPSAASSILDMEAVLTGKTSKDKANNNNFGSSGGTITRAGGRGGNRATSGGIGADDDDGLAAGDNSGEFVIAAGVSPFPEPNYGGTPNRDESGDNNGYGFGASSSGPKRSKSLIKRMKSARQNPNMPVLKLDTTDIEMGSAGKKGSPSSSPITPSNAADARRMRHLSSPTVLASPGSRGSPLAPQVEEGYVAAPADYMQAGEGADRGRPEQGGGGGGGALLGSGLGRKGSIAASRSRSPGSPGGVSPGHGGESGLGRSGSLFSKFGRKARAA
ncbi:hypothetical protein A4X13_0g5069 [Tilletia indica]|uniref:Pal1 cell morphology protein n=1 Tax=Tilletia indica TaxID=43049 RepID=A0A177TED8_9BASI|nr:hypothetical protein A4X13_0g5069 [Tilletia indica]